MLAEFEECTYLQEGKCNLGGDRKCKCEDFIPLIEWVRGYGKDKGEDNEQNNSGD